MWRPAHQFHLLQPPLILFLLHTLADKEEVGEEVLADQGVVALVALAGQGALEGQADLATQGALVDTVAMAEEGLDIQGMTPQGGPSMTPCPSLHKCLVC